ncbi:META domain-containing protein [Isoptericola croceus]|uniref:META domain-containing protein n=1 Tax=Isoptericola croceus TaxID=3031406 RepID=UPI0023F6C776|nr:META domain-containing protein [Isoptericola croceus]
MRPLCTARHAVVLLLAVATLAACAGPAGVAGRSFTATSVTGRDIVEGSQIVVAFTDDSVGAQPGCNSMSAPATWDDGTLRLTGELQSTMMACSEELMEQDDWFSELLGSAPTLALDGDTLTLTGSDVTVTLVERD